MTKKQEQIIQIVENIGNIFNISDEVKNKIFQKISLMKDEDIYNVAKLVSDYNKETNDTLLELSNFIKKTNIKAGEITEKKDDIKDIDKLFDEL